MRPYLFAMVAALAVMFCAVPTAEAGCCGSGCGPVRRVIFAPFRRARARREARQHPTAAHDCSCGCACPNCHCGG